MKHCIVCISGLDAGLFQDFIEKIERYDFLSNGVGKFYCFFNKSGRLQPDNRPGYNADFLRHNHSPGYNINKCLLYLQKNYCLDYNIELYYPMQVTSYD